MNDNMNMKGKVCLVTGGGRGLGRAICERLAAAGAEKVYVGDLNTDGAEDMRNTFPNVEGMVMNVTDAASIAEALNIILEAEGRIDVLVNNAGITRDALIQKMSDSDWDDVININLKGVFMMTREVAPHMMSQGAGSIINMASVVGLDGNVGQSNYAATKGGVISLTKSWAKEFARKGAAVRCNAIAPGFIRTPMTEKVPDKVLDFMVGKTPLGRMGEPGDVASCALFLASDESSFVTAQTIRVDGGLVL